MHNRISKTGPRRPRMKLSRSLQEQLLNAVAREGAEHPPNLSVQSSAKANLPDVPAKSMKRQLDEIDQSAAKRPRLLTEVEGDRAQSADKTAVIQNPKPKSPYAAFLKNFVESSLPRSGSVDSSVSEWLESVGSDRNTYCRSDSCLSQFVSEPVPRQGTKSVPQMDYTRDADGFMVPPTPISTGSRSRADIESASVASDVTGFSSSSSRASGRVLVEDPLYRDMNLAVNNIYLRPLREQLPNQIAELVNHVRRDRDSPGPSTEEVWEDAELNELWMGAGESKVEDYFRDKIFPKSRSGDVLDRSDRQPMARHTVPNAGSKLKVSNPKPDMLFGYNRHGAFPQQQAQLISMGAEMVANSQNLVYPFFVVEFKGDGPSGGGALWVETNQCLGGAASCVNIAERLNRQLAQCKSDEVRLINSAAFSIAMSGTEARLYISWKPDDYLEFRKYVRNIIDWGKEKRLSEIRSSLDTLLKASRERASEVAKSRPPPSDSSVTSSKRGKSSSRGRAGDTESDFNEPSGAEM
ncbi:hypothetical protein VP1G_09713 [Cytospora mali]|uniref:DUF7924 domain-containing protein n=1 Tax=Cytospora mali TaxID=578113 RepID=A0A194VFD6_CYTMA|nr:hypothetical protein VP1G_09713 [Valsa mali var. pyri (nom. inval.)]